MGLFKKIKDFIKIALRRSYAKYILRNSELGKNVQAKKKLIVLNPNYMKIGNDCYFGPDCRIEAWTRYLDEQYSPVLILGDDVRINSTCHIGCINKIIIGSQTLLGSHVLIIDHSHGCNSVEEMCLHPSERKLFSKGDIVIGERCWLCDNTVVLPGVHIGNEVIVAANAVVTKDIPNRCVVAGNPAKIVKRIEATVPLKETI